jgi:streptogramin lyase
VPLPGAHAFCNDIAVDARGAIYVTDSAGPNVLRLSAGASTFEVFATSTQFSPPEGGIGLDGIAVGHDGNLYVTTYTAGGLFRVDVKAVCEGQLSFLFDPAKRTSSPSLPFRIYAVPLVRDQTR